MPVTNQPPGSIGANVRQQLGSGGLMSGIGIGGAGVYQYQPPEEHLVQGRLNGLMNENSNYMQQARGNAMEVSNARGMGSGAYAVGAAQRAAIDAALPIASQDSETLTRTGLANAAANQDYTTLLSQLEGARASQGGNFIMEADPMEREHELQLQRERLAFEGEQNAYGRAQQNSMAEFDLYGNLVTGEHNFGNQRTMNWDDFGFQQQLGRDQFGYQSDLRGQDYLYGNALQRSGADLGLRSDYARYGMDSAASQRNMWSNMIMAGMQNPEFMADPEGFFGFMQYASGQVPGAGADFFSNLYGGGRRGRGG